MEPYTCPSSAETSTENQIDELPWSGTEEILVSIIDVASNEVLIPCSMSTSTTVKLITDENQHTTLDMLGHGDEVLLCSSDDETSSSMEEENEEEVLWEMINVGLEKFVSTDQDSAGKSWSIYKVEKNLKKVHEESTFHPKLVSIGPFHHNKSEHLKLMEQHKWRSLSDFLKPKKLITSCDIISFLIDGGTTANDNGDDNDDDDEMIMTKKKQCLVAAMENLEAEARACYSETFDDLGSKEFVMMMLLDGCFIVQQLLEFQLLLPFQDQSSRPRNDVDSIFSWRSRLPNLRHDMLLLENQLPLIVLQKIFEISGIDNETYKLTDLILEFFNPVLSREKKVLDQCKQVIFDIEQSSPHCHLLELFMSSFQIETFPADWVPGGCSTASLYPEYIPNDGRDQDVSIHCVTELREAGVEFKKRDHHDLLDIKFKNGSLHIPTLFIDGNTVPVLLNFIAYEQRHHSIKPHFTSYLMFLDYLVNASGDVEHLHYKGIINHGLGSDEEVATLFNKLCKEVVLELGDNNYLSPVFKDVNRYFGKRRNRWRAAWKHEYFRTPWAFSSFLAAIVLIVLTSLQTYFSVYAYFHPP